MRMQISCMKRDREPQHRFFNEGNQDLIDLVIKRRAGLATWPEILLGKRSKPLSEDIQMCHRLHDLSV
jgi:hypothetical protein